MSTPPPGGADWARLREHFDAALPLPPAAREALLADPALAPVLVAELRSLLAHADAVSAADAGAGAAAGATPFLGAPAASPLAQALNDASRVAAADTGLALGPWRLVAPLGAGGMGEVWRAERADGHFQGSAAVKLLKRGMDSVAVLARFAQEQQALARLNHPHIARLLDAGRSPDGRPYFVMEMVDGRPIDRACEGLALEARLQLFLQLADAVSHAHRNLLVHRDLKPGNVLVSSEGAVKLLDFGIAKALSPEAGGGSDTTQQGQRPFTPQYASPEQVRGEPVTTATDLYSLGVLLYVMLTGQRPYGRSATSAADVARAVLEEEPTRPSSVATPAPGWELARLRLQGDLDNILLKALEKPIERRYASVDALAADIRAYLGGYPVSARPASAAYVLRKFVARNRWAVAAGGLGGLGLASGLAAALLSGRAATALGLLGLAAGLGVALYQAERALRAKRRGDEQLEHVKELVRGLVLRYSYGVWLTPKGSRLMKSFVEDSLPRLEKALASAPDDIELKAIAADLYSRLAEMLGAYSVATPDGAVTAQRAARRAVALGETAMAAQRHDGAFVARIASARMTLATLAQAEGRPGDGVEQMVQALREIDRALAQRPTVAGRAHLRGARAAVQMTHGQLCDHGAEAGLGRPDEALQLFEAALRDHEAFLADRDGIAAMRAAAPEDDIDPEANALQGVGWTRLSMAMVHLKRGDVEGTQHEAQQALALFERLVRDFAPNVVYRDGLVSAANLVAHVAVRRGQAELALAASGTAWAANEQLIASEGARSKWAALKPWVAVWHGAALQMAGRAAEARPVLQDAAAHWQAQAEGAGPAGLAPMAARRSALARLWLARAEQTLGALPAALAAVNAGLQTMSAPEPRADSLLAAAELRALRAALLADPEGPDHEQARALAQQVLALPRLSSDQRALALSLVG